ncbi:unnamed protein product [Ilex paraguariensis]|uniref:Uncharacterized protein n=1 Tax=Ilex paraguariensis TaxID=185542 RepID=A0ABC8R114_9AQUA
MGHIVRFKARESQLFDPGPFFDKVWILLISVILCCDRQCGSCWFKIIMVEYDKHGIVAETLFAEEWLSRAQEIVPAGIGEGKGG